MKKQLSLILLLCVITVVLTLSAMAANVDKQGDYGNLKWVLDTEGLLTISGEGTMEDFNDTDIKAWQEHRAFFNKIIIGENVTSIGNHAFSGYNVLIDGDPDTEDILQTINISNTVTAIGDYAFYACQKLTSVNIPKSVTSIGQYAFMECSKLTSVYFEGDACDMNIATVFLNVPNGLKVYYYEGTKGWDSYASNAKITFIKLQNPTPSTPTPQEGYTAALSADVTALDVDQQLTVTVKANQAFSAAELTLTYDASILFFDHESYSAAAVKYQEGVITLAGFGESKSSYTFDFKAIGEGTASINLTSAKFSDSNDAASKDLSEATITTGSVSVTVPKPKYQVNLSDCLSGSDLVVSGDDYTFQINDKYSAYYTYTITATMGGQAVDIITDNGDGSYTISDVTGALVITATREAKKYNITYTTQSGVVGLPTNEITHPYGTDHQVTIPQNEGYTVSLTSITYKTSTIEVFYTISDDNTVTIAGSAIIDDITIVIDRKEIPKHASVSVTGSGASDANNFSNSAELGKSYTLTINEDSRYNYAVTATVDDTAETVSGSNGSYTIAGEDVTADITFTITKTLKLNVECKQYLTLQDGKSLWLLMQKISHNTGSVCTYDGIEMYWSDKYQAYCTLIVSASNTQPTIDNTKIALTTGAAVSIDYGMDVNKSGKLDTNDAQFVYNMYNVMYTGITNTVSMEKYLRADVNGSGDVDSEDAAAIINEILSLNG